MEVGKLDQQMFLGRGGPFGCILPLPPPFPPHVTSSSLAELHSPICWFPLFAGWLETALLHFHSSPPLTHSLTAHLVHGAAQSNSEILWNPKKDQRNVLFCWKDDIWAPALPAWGDSGVQFIIQVCFFIAFGWVLNIQQLRKRPGKIMRPQVVQLWLYE